MTTKFSSAGLIWPEVKIIPQKQVSKFKKGDFLEVLLGEVFSPGRFFVQLVQDLTYDLDDLVDEMVDTYESVNDAAVEISWTELKIGVHCVARLKGDRKWYRAEVVHINSLTSIQVAILDFGGSHTLPLCNLRWLLAQFCSLPAQAIEAKLAGLAPPSDCKNWQEESSVRFLELTKQACDWSRDTRGLVAVVQEAEVDGKVGLELFDSVTNTEPEGININSVLVNEGLATNIKVKLRDEGRFVEQEVHSDDNNETLSEGGMQSFSVSQVQNKTPILQYQYQTMLHRLEGELVDGGEEFVATAKESASSGSFNDDNQFVTMTDITKEHLVVTQDNADHKQSIGDRGGHCGCEENILGKDGGNTFNCSRNSGKSSGTSAAIEDLKELKMLKEALHLERKKSYEMEIELNKTNHILDNAQSKIKQMENDLEISRECELLISNLKLKCLKTEFDAAKSFLDSRLVENENLITYLNKLSSPASISLIRATIDKLKKYSEILNVAMSELQSTFANKVHEVKLNPMSDENYDLNFDLSSYDCPTLSLDEVDTLRLILSVLTHSSTRTKISPVIENSPWVTACSPTDTSGVTTTKAVVARPRVASAQRRSPCLPSKTECSYSAINDLRNSAIARDDDGVEKAETSSEQSKPKAYQQLLTTLQWNYPELSNEAAAKYVQTLRTENNGKLSNLGMQDIVVMVGELLKENLERSELVSRETHCCICLEDMKESESMRLDPCLHKFHRQCIDRWLSSPVGAKNTCPMCRHLVI